ncbi:tRNA threonylcarbamoyladenosine biosynthesis protein RimN [Endozoicomonas sp. (ex Bugula neritina AB1)]|nr:tRNA threonylcarbamoyladenosine biosynthesis protein RimN [Endozoicomonas sp. (ex Bugula neritina AB1)]
MQHPDVLKAAEIISMGGVIAYPTEAVWGLGCDPWSKHAVYQVLDIKHRPVEKGVILIGADEDQFAPLLDPLSREDRQRLLSCWPGPYTWLIPDPNNWVPEWVKGQFETVAVRISAHPVVQELCRTVGHPIISTSANRAGESPLLTHSAVEQEFSKQLGVIIHGKTGDQSAPSEIRDLRTGQLIRAG